MLNLLFLAGAGYYLEQDRISPLYFQAIFCYSLRIISISNHQRYSLSQRVSFSLTYLASVLGSAYVASAFFLLARNYHISYQEVFFLTPPSAAFHAYTFGIVFGTLTYFIWFCRLKEKNKMSYVIVPLVAWLVSAVAGYAISYFLH